MNHLLRELAPIGDTAWALIEHEAKTRLVTYLAARKLVDFTGPLGWEHSATDLGRVESIGTPFDAVVARRRRVLPLVELRAPFTVARAELDDAARGATNLELGELEEAAEHIALAENRSVFHGFPEGGIDGITAAASSPPIELPDDLEQYPTTVARAVNGLRMGGIQGPFGLAVGPVGWTRIIETTERGGYLLLEHLGHILGGPVVWAPGVSGAVVLSLRGGDFALECGQDLSIGYRAHDADTVSLYLEESVSFRVLEPDAAVHLVLPS
ncbi:MAG: bacteriocin [Acidimicrobiia bacterium]|nr:bacteriocin [Acidimicrobiia bacterium]